MADECPDLKAQYDAAIAAGDSQKAADLLAEMREKGCEDPTGSGGHGGTLPPNG